MHQRHRIIQRFHEAGRDDPRVLLMSSVGTVGLNITCANIVIFLVSAHTPSDLPLGHLTCFRTRRGRRKTTARQLGVFGDSVKSARCLFTG